MCMCEACLGVGRSSTGRGLLGIAHYSQLLPHLGTRYGWSLASPLRLPDGSSWGGPGFPLPGGSVWVRFVEGNPAAPAHTTPTLQSQPIANYYQAAGHIVSMVPKMRVLLLLLPLVTTSTGRRRGECPGGVCRATALVPGDGGWLAVAPSLAQAKALRCDVERRSLDDISAAQFQREFVDGSKPVLLYGGPPWADRAAFAREALLARLGSRRVRVGRSALILITGGTGHDIMPLGSFVQSMRDTEQRTHQAAPGGGPSDAPYVFDRGQFFADAPDLLGSLHLPAKLRAVAKTSDQVRWLKRQRTTVATVATVVREARVNCQTEGAPPAPVHPAAQRTGGEQRGKAEERR